MTQTSVFERNMALLLGRVTPYHEITMDLEGYSATQRDAVIAECDKHGMSACFDGRFFLIRVSA